MVLFIQRYGRLMRREAGAGPGSAAAMLAMLETLAALEPSQTRRSEEQLALQQFSTPLPLAYAALQAAAIRPGDIVLEPSAGTGMLAVMAECALGKRGDGARSGNPLHLNEIAAVRAGLLCRIVRARAGHPSQRGVHRRLSAGPASHRGVDEPAVFGKPRGPAQPSRRGFASPPFRLLHAPGRWTAGGDHVGRLHPRRCRLEPRLRAARSTAAHRFFHRHRRARLRTARHDLRYPADRNRSRSRECPGRSDRRTGIRPHRRRVACSHRRQCAAEAGHRAHTRGTTVPAGDLFGHAAARPTPRKRAVAAAPRVRFRRRRRFATGRPVAELDYETLPANPEGKVSRTGRPPMPGSTSPGIPGPRAFPAPANIQHRWCNPPPWRRCPIPCRRTARCCLCVS